MITSIVHSGTFFHDQSRTGLNLTFAVATMARASLDPIAVMTRQHAQAIAGPQSAEAQREIQEVPVTPLEKMIQSLLHERHGEPYASEKVAQVRGKSHADSLASALSCHHPGAARSQWSCECLLR